MRKHKLLTKTLLSSGTEVA